MDADRGNLNGFDEEHRILLNPRWPAADLARLESAAREVLARHALEPSFVLSSSGTSAGTWRDVKLILLSKRAVLAGARAVAREFGFGAADRLGDLLPPFHVGGLSVSARAFVSGGAHVDLRAGAWDARALVEKAGGGKVTVLSLVPTQLHDLVRAGSRPWPELRLLFLGGAALPAPLEASARALGWPIVATYGMTETAAMIAARAPGEEGFRPFAGVSLSTDAEGRLVVASPSLASGFARVKDDGGLVWTPIPKDRFIAEDRAKIEGGLVFILGRDGDQLKINGENVNLAALRRVMEAVAAEHGVPAGSWHLTATPDERHGHVITLVVRRGLDAGVLKSGFDARVLPYENVRRLFEVEAIPTTELGKVREEALRVLLAGEERMDKSGAPWKVGAFFVCEKCGKKNGGPAIQGLADKVKIEFKSKLKEMGHGKDLRVMTSGCLDVCPKEQQAAVFCPSSGGEVKTICFRADETEQVFDWLKKKL